LGSIKGKGVGRFFDYLSDYQLLKKSAPWRKFVIITLPPSLSALKDGAKGKQSENLDIAM
jgi:hypothetical protein